MVNIERNFEQAKFLCYLLDLNRYTSNEIILLVQACTECFLKEKLLKTRRVCSKNAEISQKG